MSINLAGYIFEGPYDSTVSLKNQGGTYVILTKTPGVNTILDVGESHEVKNRVENHDRSSCWSKNSGGKDIQYAVRYASESERRNVEQAVRQRYRPPCGEQ